MELKATFVEPGSANRTISVKPKASLVKRGTSVVEYRDGLMKPHATIVKLETTPVQTLAVRVGHETASLEPEATPVEPWATLKNLLRLYGT